MHSIVGTTRGRVSETRRCESNDMSLVVERGGEERREEPGEANCT
jgi:hypothetical protein